MSVVEVIAEVVDRGPWLRQLGDVGGDAAGLVAGEQVRRRAPSRLVLEIDVGERLAVSVSRTMKQSWPSFMPGSSTDHGGGKRRADGIKRG
jgi:hypothetical protein